MLSPVHIGFVTPDYAPPYLTGLGTYLRKVSLALTSRGHRISIVTLSQKNREWHEGAITVREVEMMPQPAWVLHYRGLRALYPALRQILNARRLAEAVRQIHRNRPFDILQATNYLSPGLALVNNGAVPVVSRLSCYTPHMRAASGRRRNFGEYIADRLEQHQILHSDNVVAPSQFAAETYARLQALRTQVIRTPLDLGRSIELDPSYYAEHLAGRDYLLFFGRLSRVKGVDLIAQIIPALAARYENLCFAFLGPDDGIPRGPKMFDYVLSCCPGLADRLIYHPGLPKAQLYPVIANATGVWMPSRVDNYPNACLEAQAMGVPVIGSDDSSLEEMIVDGETGFLVHNGSAASLRKGVEQLLAQTPEQRWRMRERILAHAQAMASEDRIGQLMTLYETTITRFAEQKTGKRWRLSYG